MADANEEKYVTRREYHNDQQKNAERHHAHDLKFANLQSQNNAMLSDLNKLPDTFKKLDSTLTKLGGRLDNAEYDYKNLDNRVAEIEAATEGKQKHNTAIQIAIIGAIPLLIGAALTFAQSFFQ